MRNKIITYLFVFVSLILLYQIVSSNKLVSYQSQKIEQLTVQKKQLQDSLNQFQIFVEDNQFFSLLGNPTEIDLLSGNYSAEQITTLVNDALYAFNEKGANSLIPNPQIKGRIFFNRVKLLNNRWVIAEFSNNIHRGQVLLSYQISTLDSVTFQPIVYFESRINELR